MKKISRIYATDRKKIVTYIRDHKKSQELSREEGNQIEEEKEREAAISIFPTNKALEYGGKT